MSLAWEIAVSILPKLTIPQTSPAEWSRFYQSANIAFCPLAVLYSCKSFIALDHPIMFLLPNTHLPFWFVVFCGSFSLAILHHIVEKEAPKSQQILSVVVAFVMSVFCISTTAGELLYCLEALGVLLKSPASLLGLTVLAWRNSIGDLVADVAVAKAGPRFWVSALLAFTLFSWLLQHSPFDFIRGKGIAAAKNSMLYAANF